MDGRQPLRNTHVKLLASDLVSLTQSHGSSSLLLTPGGASLSRAEALGTVVSRDLKPDKFLKFALDDGTATVVCVLWLNHLTSPFFSRLSPSDLRLAADAALRSADAAALGSVARVRGRLAAYRGQTQITVSDVVAETDPNAQTLHWLDCLRLARRRYHHHQALPPNP